METTGGISGAVKRSVKECAIYARSRSSKKDSTEDQIARCRTEARQRGWVLADRHVFADGPWQAGEAFHNRVGLAALFAAAHTLPRPESEVEP